MRASQATTVPVIAVLSFLLAISAFAQDAGKAKDSFLAGDWAVTLQPYAGPGVESMPLQVVSVVGAPGGGKTWIREKRLRNLSDKAVVRVAYTAFVSRKETPEVILFRTPLPAAESYVSRPLLPGTVWPAPCPKPPEYCPYGRSILGVAELLAPLVKEGSLEGEYLVAIGVTKVWFEDGSEWEFKEEQPPADAKPLSDRPRDAGRYAPPAVAAPSIRHPRAGARGARRGR